MSHVVPGRNSNQPQVVSFSCWTRILGDANNTYKVFLKAWASHTAGELHVYPDESMIHPLARFPLGVLDSSITVTENVITLQTSSDSCSFQCESKQQQRNWLGVLRFPLLSPLPINNSKGWKWNDEGGSGSGDSTAEEHGDMRNHNSLSLKAKLLTMNVKAQITIQDQQESNRKKLKDKEDCERRLAKQKNRHMKKVLLKYRERLSHEGREEELNWTKATKNMYKTLGVQPVSSPLSTPSLYLQQLKNTETKVQKTARLSRETAEGYKAARETLKRRVAMQTKAIEREQRSERQHEKDLLFEEDSTDTLHQLSSHVREYVDTNNQIKYNNVLKNTKAGINQVNSCIVIQKMWRGYTSRNVHFRLNKYYAAILIQKAWQLCKHKRLMKLNLRRLIANKREMDECRDLQERARKKNEFSAAKAREGARNRAKYVSCVTIQRGARAYLKRQRLREGEAAHVASVDRSVPAGSKSKPSRSHPEQETVRTSSSIGSEGAGAVVSSREHAQENKVISKKKSKTRKKKLRNGDLGSPESVGSVEALPSEDSAEVSQKGDLSREYNDLCKEKERDHPADDKRKGSELPDIMATVASSDKMESFVSTILGQPKSSLDNLDIDEDEGHDVVLDKLEPQPPLRSRPSYASPVASRGKMVRRLLSS